MPRREKFEEYGLKTKTTTIRIPDLKDLDRERELRREIDVFVIDFIKKGLKEKEYYNSYENLSVDKSSPEIDKNLEWSRLDSMRPNEGPQDYES